MTTDVQKPTLVYFHIGGRAEISRLLLEIAGVDYQYHSISFRNSPGEPWPEYKEKHAAELTFGQVPQYKEPGGLSIVQSASITRYLARKHGFNGSNEREAVAIDVLFEGASDLFTAIAKAAFADESKKAEEINNLLTNAAPNHLANLQRALEHNHGGQGTPSPLPFSWNLIRHSPL